MNTLGILCEEVNKSHVIKRTIRRMRLFDFYRNRPDLIFSFFTFSEFAKMSLAYSTCPRNKMLVSKSGISQA